MVMHPGFIYFLFTKFRNRPSSSQREGNAFAQQVCQAPPVLLYSFSAKQRPSDFADSFTCIHYNFPFCFSPLVVFFLYLRLKHKSPLLTLNFLAVSWQGMGKSQATWRILTFNVCKRVLKRGTKWWSLHTFSFLDAS